VWVLALLFSEDLGSATEDMEVGRSKVRNVSLSPAHSSPVTRLPQAHDTSEPPDSRDGALWGSWQPSGELLGQCDDDSVGAADVTKPIPVLVLLQLANKFGTVIEQAGEDVLNVFDFEHDATYT